MVCLSAAASRWKLSRRLCASRTPSAVTLSVSTSDASWRISSRIAASRWPASVRPESSQPSRRAVIARMSRWTPSTVDDIDSCESRSSRTLSSCDESSARRWRVISERPRRSLVYCGAGRGAPLEPAPLSATSEARRWLLAVG